VGQSCVRVSLHIVVVADFSGYDQSSGGDRRTACPAPANSRREPSFNLRLDPALKAAFTAATQAADKPAAQVIRDFMRAYVTRRERGAFEAEAGRQSRLLAAASRNPDSAEAEEMRWLTSFVDQDHSATSGSREARRAGDDCQSKTWMMVLRPP
jgi:hypothetical protein